MIREYRRPIGIVCGVLLALVSLSASAQERVKGGIQGIVSAAGTNEPIAGARITLSAKLPPEGAAPIDPVITDSRGRFEFQNLDEGEYWMSVTKNGFVRKAFPSNA